MFILIIIMLIFTATIYRYIFKPILWVSWKIMWDIIRFAIKALIIGVAIVLVVFQVMAPGV